MRIKFEKGFTPDAMAGLLVDFLEENRIDYGSVNIYIQERNAKGENVDFRNDSEIFTATPGEKTKKRAEERSIAIRRAAIKLVEKDIDEKMEAAQ